MLWVLSINGALLALEGLIQRLDGTAKVTMMGQTIQGTYKINDGNELEWTMSGITTKGKLNVTATELDVTDDANRTIKYKRK